jgi:NADH-quinone oxidoreductase subunit J
MEVFVFVLFAVLTLASAVVVVAHRNPVHSTMALVVTLVSLAVFFVMLGAPFIAALQILIYTGAILVLFLFVIMLLNVSEEEITGPSGSAVKRWGAILAAVIFAFMLGIGAWNAFHGDTVAPLEEGFVSVKGLAAALFGEYLLPFEIVGLLLLVAVIAATILARKPAPSPQEEPQP